MQTFDWYCIFLLYGVLTRPVLCLPILANALTLISWHTSYFDVLAITVDPFKFCVHVCVHVCVRRVVGQGSLQIKGVGKLVQIYCLCQLCQIWQAQMVSLQMVGVYVGVRGLSNIHKSVHFEHTLHV